MKKIKKCKNNHYFLEKICPYCGETHIEIIEYQVGDCISCGKLCPRYAYGCNTVDPIAEE